MSYKAKDVALSYTDRQRLREAAAFRLRWLAFKAKWLRVDDGESYLLATALHKLKWAEREVASAPPGATLHEMGRPQVSEDFLRSLVDAGVSEETIRSIRRDNERATRSTPTDG